jgi:hypothetical protein
LPVIRWSDSLVTCDLTPSRIITVWQIISHAITVEAGKSESESRTFCKAFSENISGNFVCVRERNVNITTKHSFPMICGVTLSFPQSVDVSIPFESSFQFVLPEFRMKSRFSLSRSAQISEMKSPRNSELRNEYLLKNHRQ